MIDITGIAHLCLNINHLETGLPFYEKVMGFMGLKKVWQGEKGAYFVGGKTAVAIQLSDPQYRSEPFVQTRIGFHHVCFRARSTDDIDQMYEFLKSVGAKIIHPPEEGPWGPGYYSVLFEDPDGLRLEVNHVPGKGIFNPGAKFNSAGYE